MLYLLKQRRPSSIEVEVAGVATVTLARIYRFWRYVDIRGDDECWEWLGSHYFHSRPDGKAYGKVVVAGHEVHAHRMAYALVYQDLDPSKIVMHRCDNPGCCNPLHLAQADYADNVWDMHFKRRHPLSGRVLRNVVASRRRAAEVRA